jgi:hypothetical protein
MSLGQRTSTAGTGLEPVVAWRVRKLRDAGLGPGLAAEIAANPGYDLHALLELVDRGCPADLAARILAPLDGPVVPC